MRVFRGRLLNSTTDSVPTPLTATCCGLVEQHVLKP